MCCVQQVDQICSLKILDIYSVPSIFPKFEMIVFIVVLNKLMALIEHFHIKKSIQHKSDFIIMNIICYGIQLLYKLRIW